MQNKNQMEKIKMQRIRWLLYNLCFRFFCCFNSVRQSAVRKPQKNSVPSIKYPYSIRFNCFFLNKQCVYVSFYVSLSIYMCMWSGEEQSQLKSLKKCSLLCGQYALRAFQKTSGNKVKFIVSHVPLTKTFKQFSESKLNVTAD